MLGETFGSVCGIDAISRADPGVSRHPATHFSRRRGPGPPPVVERLPNPCPYPIAIGAVAAAHGIDRVATLAAYLTALVQTQVSVAVRLVPLGQVAGLAVIAALEPAVAALAAFFRHREP